MKPANSCAASCATILPEHEAAALTGQELLAELGCEARVTGTADHPAIAWKKSGLFGLSGHADGPPRMFPVPLTTAVDGAILALKTLTDRPGNLPVNGASLLGERARLMELSRNNRSSPGGSCRLIDARDGRFALNLARDEDWDLLDAWLETSISSWQDISAASRMKSAIELVTRGAELGLAIALDELAIDQPWMTETIFVPSTNESKSPLVVDLSSLWAGPLTGSLMSQMGARVIKVESLSRPDGGRRGHTGFYDLLNAGKQCAAFDFGSKNGRSDLRKLIRAADIVIEASRPRALRQLGIDAPALVAEKPGKLWLRLTAYGADSSRIGFGDDIGVASGICTIMEKAWGQPYFAGDAIADPVSGIFGALAAWVKWTGGGGRIIDLSMRDVMLRAMGRPEHNEDWASIASDWQTIAEQDKSPFYALRKIQVRAENSGASTDSIMASLC